MSEAEYLKDYKTAAGISEGSYGHVGPYERI
jgi:hypothetical protein